MAQQKFQGQKERDHKQENVNQNAIHGCVALCHSDHLFLLLFTWDFFSLLNIYESKSSFFVQSLDKENDRRYFGQVDGDGFGFVYKMLKTKKRLDY